jgi:hypothetical protein
LKYFQAFLDEEKNRVPPPAPVLVPTSTMTTDDARGKVMTIADMTFGVRWKKNES